MRPLFSTIINVYAALFLLLSIFAATPAYAEEKEQKPELGERPTSATYISDESAPKLFRDIWALFGSDRRTKTSNWSASPLVGFSLTTSFLVGAVAWYYQGYRQGLYLKLFGQVTFKQGYSFRNS